MKSMNTLKMVLDLNYIIPEGEEQNKSYYGLGKLGVELADFMGCPYHFVAPKQFANGTSENLVGAMFRSGADIVLRLYGAIPDLYDNYDNITLSYPVEIDEYAFLARRLTPSPNPSAIFQPFSPFVWVSLEVSIIAITFAILCFFKKLNLSDSAFSVLATVSRQRPFLKPKTTSERILMGSWLLGMTIITAAYLSLLLSYLTFPNLREPRNKLELANAVKKGDYQCYTQNNILHGLRNSSIETHRIIGNNIMKLFLVEFLNSPATKTAYLERRRVCTMLEEIYPMIVISEDAFFSSHSVFVIRKDFRFKGKMNRALRRMIETGIYAKATYVPTYRYRYTDLEQLSNRKLTLVDFKVVFIILVVGYGVSTLILLLEILTYKQKRLKRSKRRNY